MRSGIGFWRSKRNGGDTYYGQYKQNKKNGYGVYKEKSGKIYRGEHIDDHREGKGSLTFQSGNEIFGTWVRDKLFEIEQRIVLVMEQDDSQNDKKVEELLKSHLRSQKYK